LAAHARDGQIDIRPTGAATFTINASGSYVLVGNVTMSAAVTCIQITAGDVILDLNGHTITGFGSGAGTAGIDAVASNESTIFNGTVRGFTGGLIPGVLMGSNAYIHGVRVTGSGSY